MFRWCCVPTLKPKNKEFKNDFSEFLGFIDGVPPPPVHSISIPPELNKKVEFNKKHVRVHWDQEGIHHRQHRENHR